ncbi:16S rRNA (cytosine(967)-C(5))-methyltransferase RsmB [Candidatus Halobeggiatoa sp. HSG11]|nr:16S rRNA (cytosine(967)-C(5))-methyltransferase RsmB [Candidatus Halobeggiatoa sp. HSG11]
MPNARSVATKILNQVIWQRRSLTDCLSKQLPNLTDTRERALAQELCYGVLRWLLRLQAILPQLLHKKMKDRDIQVLLLIGLYQLIYLRIPSYAAIAATVEVTRDLKKTKTTGLVNAILRNFQRNSEKILATVDKNIEAKLSHPNWILKRLQTDWPNQWEDIATANNTHPPMTLRINTKVMARDKYIDNLQQLNIESYLTPDTSYGITLKQPTDVRKLPGFNGKDAYVSVQDGAAQLAIELLDVPSNAKVLDACAAPGGKMAHLLECHEVELLALDNQAERVDLLHNTLQRLNLTAKIKHADACQPETWWDGKLFDRILLDAPCSASGVIRRHPDIKHLRKPEDIANLVQQQATLLEKLWPLLAPNGKLLYVTCSVFAEENHLQIKIFLAKQTDAHEVKLNCGQSQIYGRQILPGEFDGFYYACLAKT